jgi:hypothetical protein
LNQIASEDADILQAVMDVMETDSLLESEAPVELVPRGNSVILDMDPHTNG